MKEEAALPLTRTVPLVSEETEKVTPAASSSESEKLRSVVVIVYVSPSVTVAASVRSADHRCSPDRSPESR